MMPKQKLPEHVLCAVSFRSCIIFQATLQTKGLASKETVVLRRWGSKTQ